MPVSNIPRLGKRSYAHWNELSITRSSMPARTRFTVIPILSELLDGLVKHGVASSFKHGSCRSLSLSIMPRPACVLSCRMQLWYRPWCLWKGPVSYFRSRSAVLQGYGVPTRIMCDRLFHSGFMGVCSRTFRSITSGSRDPSRSAGWLRKTSCRLLLYIVEEFISPYTVNLGYNDPQP